MTIIGLLRRLFNRPVVVEGFSRQRLRDTEPGKLGKIIMQNKCPDCGGEGFYEGPSGGASTNIFCAHCGQGFNFANIFGQGWAERIHKIRIIERNVS